MPAPTASPPSPCCSAPGGVALGWQQADPIIGLVITIAILGALRPAPCARRSAAKQAGARLMDAVDPGLVDQATAAASVTGITAVSELLIRWIGHTLRAEVEAPVEPSPTLIDAYDLAHHAEAHLLEGIPRHTATTIHLSPRSAHTENHGRGSGSVQSD
jgi:divalent metal cation (Fe/Co/Zn/Cd) transporter